MAEAEIVRYDTSNLQVLAPAEEMVVRNREQHDLACELLAECRRVKASIKKFYADVKQPFADKLKTVRGWEKADLDVVETHEDALTAKVSAYRDRERKRAERVAEAKRQRLQEAAEREAMERAEQEADDPVVAAELEALRSSGPATVTTKQPDFSGTAIGDRAVWKAEVTDFQALCRAVADGYVSTEPLVEPNWPALHRLATAMGEMLEETVPGVRAVKHTGLVRRR